MDLAAIAAFTAAGLTLVNVGISARLTRTGSLEQWMRDTERPIVAKALLSQDAAKAWREAESFRGQYDGGPDRTIITQAGDAWRRGISLFDQLNFEFAQLDLIAGDPLRERARALLVLHDSLRHTVRPTSGSSASTEREEFNTLAQFADQLIAAARADLGVD
jgi:hypothetical protein